MVIALVVSSQWYNQYLLQPVADLGAQEMCSPLSPIIVVFIQFSVKIMPNNRLAPPGVGVNPRSATGIRQKPVAKLLKTPK